MMRHGFLFRLGGHHRSLAFLRSTVGLQVPVGQRGWRLRLSRRRRRRRHHDEDVVVVIRGSRDFPSSGQSLIGSLCKSLGAVKIFQLVRENFFGSKI